MRRSTVRRCAVALGVLITTLLSIGGMTAAPAAADPAPDLQVSVAYGQAAYNSTDTFTVTLTITNNSDLEADFLQTFTNGACVTGVDGWPKLGSDFTIPGHTTVSDTETGGNPIDAGLGGTATCSGAVTNFFDPSVRIPYSTSITVNQVFGDYHGVVFRDRNHDGTFEPGEGVDGITARFSITGFSHTVTETAMSGPDGQVDLVHIPVGTYFVEFTSRRNWVIDDPNFVTNGGDVTVTQAAQPTQFLPVIPPLSDRLTAKFGFDQASYQPTDTIHLTVTLTNTGKQPITGVIADCNRNGDGNAPFSFDGWGALSINGPGATIPADTAVTFHIDLPMPADAQADGYVKAPCVFGPEPNSLPEVGFPGGDPTAKVPGLTADEVLQFVRSDNTTVPVTGLRVRIVDQIAHQVVTVATTDANGEITLPTLPAGLYTLHPLGGFRIPAGLSNELIAVSPGSSTNVRSYDVTPPTS